MLLVARLVLRFNIEGRRGARLSGRILDHYSLFQGKLRFGVRPGDSDEGDQHSAVMPISVPG